jgi:Fe-S cluster biogenesis protein NfuA
MSRKVFELFSSALRAEHSPQSRRKIRLAVAAAGAVCGAILAVLLTQPWEEFIITTIASGPAIAAGPAGHADSPLGMNLSPVTDWTDEDPFLDFFKMSREWIPLCDPSTDSSCTTWWDTGEQNSIELDENGWVKRLPAVADAPMFTRVATLMMTADTDNPHNDYTGAYIVLYDGEGEIGYSNGGAKVSGSPGRDVITVAKDGHLQLTITRTDPNGTGNYLRNIRVVRQAHESLLGSRTFNPAWLAKLDGFRTLRFMDWMRTNGSRQQDFGNRPKVTDARYTSDQGVPLEAMVNLANAADSEPWFNMPHKATDDYVARFAAYVRVNLGAHLKVYVEYSNEIWNGAFSQGSDIESWAQAELPGGSDSGFTKRINWHGKRSAEVCRIWKNAFGDQANRVICVLGAQAANSWTASQALECPLYQPYLGGKTCREMGLNAVAIAPYFGGYLGSAAFKDQVKTLTVNDLFTEINEGGVVRDTNPSDWDSVPAGGALTEAFHWMDDYDSLARAKDVRVLAYEGGQHLVGAGDAQNDPDIEALFKAANRDSRMGEAYTAYLNHWKSEPSGGMALFVPFLLAQRYGKFGSWGTLEYIDQPSSPKYDALTAFASSNACWWTDCSIQGSGGSSTQNLTVSITGAGQVAGNPAGISCGPDCEEAYATGTAVTLTANPANGNAFIGWGGACAGTGSTCTVTMDAAKSVSAGFAPVYTVTVTNQRKSYGTVISDPSGIDCGSACSLTVLGGATVTLTAKPVNGRRFYRWSGACRGYSTTCVLSNITVDQSVTATFR